MDVSFIVTVGRVTNVKVFMKNIGLSLLRRNLHYIAIEGKDNLDKFTTHPFWGCHYMKFNALTVINKIFKETPDHIVIVKTGDGPEKLDVKIKDFEPIDQLFYQNKFPGFKGYGKKFGSGDDGE